MLNQIAIYSVLVIASTTNIYTKFIILYINIKKIIYLLKLL